MVDPSAPGFFDREAVDKELRRLADICLCPSFRALDRPEVDGEAERLAAIWPGSPSSATNASSASRTAPITRRTDGKWT